MSNTCPQKSHTAMWCVGAMLLLPLLYLLSVPAVLWCARIKSHPQDLKYHKTQPQWAKDFCVPYLRALGSDTPLKKPLEAYTTLWGYKRSPLLLKAEQMLRETEALVLKHKKHREELEKRLEAVRERRAPGLPQLNPKLGPKTNPPAEPPPEPRGYESLLRKSS